MIIQVCLEDNATPMWFLEDENRSIHLTYMNKGPVSIDFDTLTTTNQEYVFDSVKNGYISSDASLADLSRILLADKRKEIDAMEEEMPEELKKYTQSLENKKLKEKIIVAETKRAKIAETMEKRAKSLAGSSVRAVRAALAKEENVALLLAVLKFEKDGKNRSTVKNLVNNKLQTIRDRKIRESNKEDVPVASAGKDIYDRSSIEETEIEMIRFPTVGGD
jgi:hypothetical protein